MSLLESAVIRLQHLLTHDLTFLIGLLAAIAVILSTTLWLVSRRQRKAPAPKTAPKPSSPTVVPPAVPGQKTLAERLKELDEIEERHRVRTIEEIAKYKKYTYDPLACAALEHFQPIKKNTHCVFAPASRVSSRCLVTLGLCLPDLSYSYYLVQSDMLAPLTGRDCSSSFR